MCLPFGTGQVVYSTMGFHLLICRKQSIKMTITLFLPCYILVVLEKHHLWLWNHSLLQMLVISKSQQISGSRKLR